MKEPLVFLLMGRSGCGKGTQAELLIKFFKKEKLGKILYVYTGDEFRKFFRKKKNFTAEMAHKIELSGNLEPSFLSVWLWSRKLVEKMTPEANLIMDGAPRNLTEAKIMNDAFDFYARNNIKPIYLEVSRSWAMEKLLNRKREDDTIESINKRFDFFDRSVMPVIGYYEGKSEYKLIRINGEQSVEAVHWEILKKVFK